MIRRRFRHYIRAKITRETNHKRQFLRIMNKSNGEVMDVRLSKGLISETTRCGPALKCVRQIELLPVPVKYPT